MKNPRASENGTDADSKALRRPLRRRKDFRTLALTQSQRSDSNPALPDSKARHLDPRKPEPVYDLATIGFVSLDRQGRIRRLNQKTCRLLGFPATWLIGSPFVVHVATHDVGH